jgi:MFS superfamily sulfate permease-like transporter
MNSGWGWTTWLSTARRELFASIVVFLVALPLCMGIAVASGAPVASGLITGIVGGLIVGLLAGAPLQVSGPAAGLTVIVYEVISTYGSGALGLVVLGAGGLQIAAGLLRFGPWFRAVAPAVIHGMLSGIGVLILVSQLHVLVDDKPRSSALANIASIPQAIVKGLPLPDWGNQAQRVERKALLQQLGDLHERQVEILTQIEHSISIHGDNEIHVQQAKLLPELAAQQTKLRDDLAALDARLDERALLPEGERQSNHLAETLKQAIEQSQSAVDDLQHDRWEQILISQHAAVASLADLSAAGKNHAWAAKIGLLTISLLLIWQYLTPRALRQIPAPLVAVASVTLLTTALSVPVNYVELPAKLSQGINFISLAVLKDVSWSTLIVPAILMAVIASAETLLCATAVDQMHTGPRTRYNRELIAQGIGNSICGALGALPMTGVIVRSAANVQAGAQSRWSAFMHGLWLLLFVVLCGNLLRLIPTAALAGVLVYTGYKLIRLDTVRELWRVGKSEVFIYLATLITVVAEDLLTGVIVGIVLSAMRLLVQFSRLRVRLELDQAGHSGVLTLDGVATFLRLPLLAAQLEQVPPGTTLRVDLHELDYVDHACLELLSNWGKQHEATGGRLELDWAGLQTRFRRPLRRNQHRRTDPRGLPAAAPTWEGDPQHQ